MANQTVDEATKKQIEDQIKNILENEAFEDFIFLESEKEKKQARS